MLLGKKNFDRYNFHGTDNHAIIIDANKDQFSSSQFPTPPLLDPKTVIGLIMAKTVEQGP